MHLETCVHKTEQAGIKSEIVHLPNQSKSAFNVTPLLAGARFVLHSADVLLQLLETKQLRVLVGGDALARNVSGALVKLPPPLLHTTLCTDRPSSLQSL
jgi:hypothetical protein